MGKVGAGLACDAREIHECEDFLHPGQGLFLTLPLPAEEDAHESDIGAEMAAGENVLGDREFVEQGRRLEGAHEAQGGDGMSRHARDVPPGVDDAPLRRPVEPGDHVEGRGLSGAVGPDESMNRPLLHGEGEIVDRRQAAESPCQALDVQHGSRAPGRGCRRLRSCSVPGMSVGGSSTSVQSRTISHTTRIIKWPTPHGSGHNATRRRAGTRPQTPMSGSAWIRVLTRPSHLQIAADDRDWMKWTPGTILRASRRSLVMNRSTPATDAQASRTSSPAGMLCGMPISTGLAYTVFTVHRPV